MTIGKMINDYGKKHSPYMGNLVNHLPMGQLALYQMTQNIEKVEVYSKKFVEMYSVDPVETDVEPAESIKECVGKRDHYAACLPLMQKTIREEGVEKSVRSILNQYQLGMSSGLFHVLIRLAYAVEGANINNELEEEVARALAYYVTAYREITVLERRIPHTDVVNETKQLHEDPSIQRILREAPSLGKKMKALYNSETYLNKGFLIQGEESEKVTGLLSVLVPAFIKSNDILVLHCITGLHALLNLRPFFDDFQKGLDIYTTCCLTHLLTLEKIDFSQEMPEKTEKNWETLMQKGSASRDVHTIKFTYTGHQLENKHGYQQSGLKGAVEFRVN